ncbi:hypothetical protein ES731_01185 [Psychroflexus gondwanensis]|uniref:DUF6625 family protein n=1 Tax=Psychroflexus gondwanensis TaxID=251 RepID=UPI0011BE857E|nr:DUF6625 family protein [Psychroflexus gondwanensis]TXE21548.1 hypothetical protein ES731_01185 [Psychroflexus gondwanensis]
MKSILLIIPYFGNWPLWFEAYLVSIQANPSIQWLCPTNCELPEQYPDNIKFLETDMLSLNEHVNEVVDAKMPLSPRKFCDLKPAYGDIFKEEIKGYDYWGFCDMDIIWGDIRKFMTTQVLTTYNIISSRKENISGHFNLFKNTPDLNLLYKQVPDYKSLFEQEPFMWFDEHVLSNFLKHTLHPYKIKWDTILCNQENGRDSHQEYELNRWYWKEGQLTNTQTGKEVMYLHFINWKRTMRFSEVRYKDNPKPFYISYKGMHYKKYSNFKLIFNAFKNVFFGYYIRLKRKKLEKKLKKFNL